MKWLNVIGVFFKGLFGWANNPERWYLKKKRAEIQAPVEEAKAEAKVERVEHEAKIEAIEDAVDIVKAEAKAEKKIERIADKKEFGPAPNIKKKRQAKKKANKTAKTSRKANRG